MFSHSSEHSAAPEKWNVFSHSSEHSATEKNGMFSHSSKHSASTEKSRLSSHSNKYSISNTTTVPDHLKDVYEASCHMLIDEQKAHLAGRLIEFEDVFAKNELDLGNFTEIEHAIDTKGCTSI
ncbi:hypothetical protein DPMN_156804 [Dreissena polymorpha]|uniref:Uncharacterized protein n=1 Tax=Dreissena polymorpha TaxID=45954 RepID=A0A9D4JB51_DREPO|nr:hypothetical protein DPMN_156804 [Dreissena polymorpha]